MRVLHEQGLEPAHLGKLGDPLRHVLRRADEEIAGLEEFPVQRRTGLELLARVREDLAAAERIVVDEGGQDGRLGLAAGRLHRGRHVEVPQHGLARRRRDGTALDPRPELRVELHALPHPAGRRLPVAGLEPELRGEADRAVGRHGHPEGRVRPLIRLGRDAQFQDPVAVLPCWVGRIARMCEPGVRGRKGVVRTAWANRSSVQAFRTISTVSRKSSRFSWSFRGSA